MTQIVEAIGSDGKRVFCDYPIKYSVFGNASSTRRVDRREGTWSGLIAALVAAPLVTHKDARPLLKLSIYGDQLNAKGSLRHADNILEMWGVEGDYDSELVSVDEAIERLRGAGIEAVVYTTMRHTETTPRWRVLAPLSRPHSPDAHGELVGLLNAALGGILAAESWTLGQNYFYGRMQGVQYRVERSVGEPLDCFGMVFDPLPCQIKRAPGAPAGATRIAEAGDLERDVVLASTSDETVSDVRSALEHLKQRRPDLFDDYGFWVPQLGQALKSLEQAGHGAEAHTLWHQASEGPRYDYEEAEAKWHTLAPNHITFRSIFTWAAAEGWVNPRSRAALVNSNAYEDLIDRTDMGNANLLCQLAGGDLRFVPERKCWLSWNGDRWSIDEHGSAVQAAALRVAQHYAQKAVELAAQDDATALDEKERKRIASAVAGVRKWEGHCRNRSPLDAMCNLASKKADVQVSTNLLDANPALFGVHNGVIDLNTGELRPAGRDDLVTKRSPVAFHAGAVAPRWVQFIDEITGRPIAPDVDTETGEVDAATVGRYAKRPALASYLQRALGYSLTGLTREHKMFICIGEGSNGKNILLDTLQWIMGGYCQTLAPEALMATRLEHDAERPTPAAASLAGARCAISSESKEGQRLDVALVKRHTGGGFMTARGMRENTFRFGITHKLWLMTNHRPGLDHLDDAMRGRLHIVPFDCKWNRPGHPERDPRLPDGDKTLMDTLKDEAEGILAWLIEGARAYFAEGLEPPPEVINRTQDFFQHGDALGRWLEGYEVCLPKEGMGATDLYNAFSAWLERERLDDPEIEPAISQKAFSQRLRKRAIPCTETRGGMLYGLRPQIFADLV